MQRVAAAWVVPVDAPPIAQGAVLLDDRGRIEAVGRADTVPVPAQAERIDLDEAVLLPGLVNAHTHLELTGFGGRVQATDFLDWIRQVIRIKAGRSEEAFFEMASLGIRQQWGAGVTTFCDTGSTGAVIAAMHHVGASGVAHHEVFGADPAEAGDAMRRYGADLDRLSASATGRIALGLSPHAPYTVSGALYAASAQLAHAHGAPMAVHVAEPPDESALLSNFTGIFAEEWRRRGIPRPTTEPVTPLAWLERHGVLSPRTLCIHAIGATSIDTEMMSRCGVAVAHCPRSNRVHHGADAPVRRFLDAGLRLGLGTDSEISVDPPDLWAEGRAAGGLTGWSAAETLRALTLGGATALGLEGECGSLATGKWGDMVALRVPVDDDPVAAVLAGGGASVVATWLGGRVVHRKPAAWRT